MLKLHLSLSQHRPATVGLTKSLCVRVAPPADRLCVRVLLFKSPFKRLKPGGDCVERLLTDTESLVRSDMLSLFFASLDTFGHRSLHLPFNLFNRFQELVPDVLNALLKNAKANLDCKG